MFEYLRERPLKAVYFAVLLAAAWMSVLTLFVFPKVDGLQVHILKTAREVIEDQKVRNGALPPTQEESELRANVDKNVVFYIRTGADSYRIYTDDGRFSLAIDDGGKFSDSLGKVHVNHFILNTLKLGGNIWIFAFLALCFSGGVWALVSGMKKFKTA